MTPTEDWIVGTLFSLLSFVLTDRHMLTKADLTIILVNQFETTVFMTIITWATECLLGLSILAVADPKSHKTYVSGGPSVLPLLFVATRMFSTYETPKEISAYLP